MPGEFAAAVALVVEALLADYLIAADLQAALAPVLSPPDDRVRVRKRIVHKAARPFPGGADLVEVLPP